MNDRNFLKYLKKQIPTHSRTDVQADYNYRNLHWLIDTQLKRKTL